MSSSVALLKQEYIEALKNSMLRTNPSWDITAQANQIESEVNNMFANLSQIISEEQILNNVNNVNNTSNTTTTMDILKSDQLLSMINPIQLNIPRETYSLIQESIDHSKSILGLIGLVIKTIRLLPRNLRSFDPVLNINSLERNLGIYCYLYRNILSILSNPILDPFKILQLLSLNSLEEIISLTENLYGPFASLKYLDITNINYTHPINLSTDLVEAVTTVISQRLQINPSDISSAVNRLTDEQLSALLATISNFPRLRTVLIKLGFHELDMFVVDGLMTTKFQAVKKYYSELFPNNLREKAKELFSRVLLDQNMKEYSPVILEMNYIYPTINQAVIRNINRSKIPAMRPLQEFMSRNIRFKHL